MADGEAQNEVEATHDCIATIDRTIASTDRIIATIDRIIATMGRIEATMERIEKKLDWAFYLIIASTVVQLGTIAICFWLIIAAVD